MAPEKDWGIAVGIRSANIPYPSEVDRVEDFIPLMFYDGDTPEKTDGQYYPVWEFSVEGVSAIIRATTSLMYW